MPISMDLPAGKRVRFTLEIRGPRSAVQGKRFKKALDALLRKNRTTVVRGSAKVISKRRRR